MRFSVEFSAGQFQLLPVPDHAADCYIRRMKPTLPLHWADEYPTLEILRRRALKRIPLVAREYLESGTGGETALDRNRAGLDRITITPGILKAVPEVDLRTTLLGSDYAAPFGIAPVGLTGLMWPGAEFCLAGTAGRNGIPYCLSTVATQTPEAIGPLLPPGSGWFQLYPPRRRDVRDDLLARARDNGFDTLVVTADVPVPSRRERIRKAGLRMPPRTTPRMVVDTLTHIHWLGAVLRHGMPKLRTVEPYTEDKSRAAVAMYVQEELGGTLDWKYFDELRTAWHGPVLLKGVLSADDALRAAEHGADGIVVSNHGGRQFDACPAAIDVLPEIAAAAGNRLAVVFDSGIRSGLDIIKALRAGADFVLLGRGFLYGLAALGDRGSDHVCGILLDEMRNNMIQMGCSSVSSLRGSAGA